jgi:hypothetical protein
MAHRQRWEDMTKSEKITGLAIFAGLVLLVVLVVTVMNSGKDNDVRSSNLANRVSSQLDKLDDETKDKLASTGADGYRGEIVGVEPHSDSTVKVKVSTQFKTPGDEKDGGQGIARDIFNMVCADVPELDSLYVESTNTGLQSRSIDRDQTVCR